LAISDVHFRSLYFAEEIHLPVQRRPHAARLSSSWFPLFDHFVGACQHRLRHSEAERLGGPEVDDQLKGRRLLDRQIGGLGALEDLSRVSA